MNSGLVIVTDLETLIRQRQDELRGGRLPPPTLVGRIASVLERIDFGDALCVFVVAASLLVMLVMVALMVKELVS